MILLLGASGYIGEAFAKELQLRKQAFIPLARAQVDYTRFDSLLEFLRVNKPAFVVNAAGYTGKPNVDACELDQAGTLAGNTLLPQTIAHACAAANIPWGHVSSGCIFSGAKISAPGTVRVEKDMTKAELHALAEGKSAALLGFTENDPPNFSFRDQPCSFYSGTKALGEEVLAGAAQCYIWRLRIPFNEGENPRNYLTKVMRYQRLLEARNSLSQLDEFVRACFACWQKRVPFGIYNVTNPGSVTTREIVELIKQSGVSHKQFDFFSDEAEFMRVAAKTPRSNCVLDTTKLQQTGIVLTEIHDAVVKALRRWKTTS